MLEGANAVYFTKNVLTCSSNIYSKLRSLFSQKEAFNLLQATCSLRLYYHYHTEKIKKHKKNETAIIPRKHFISVLANLPSIT